VYGPRSTPNPACQVGVSVRDPSSGPVVLVWRRCLGSGRADCASWQYPPRIVRVQACRTERSGTWPDGSGRGGDLNGSPVPCCVSDGGGASCTDKGWQKAARGTGQGARRECEEPRLSSTWSFGHGGSQEGPPVPCFASLGKDARFLIEEGGRRHERRDRGLGASAGRRSGTWGFDHG
jgi:hypothetical protein